MCGITGLLVDPAADLASVEDVAEAMTARLTHRGPDDEGVWADPTEGIALGHSRLAVIDLSEAGAQPMHGPDGRFTIVYNGEIYNFPDLRERLEAVGHTFRGTSDTEVFLAAIDEWGLDEALSRCIGMFSFALWDADRGRLHLVRDRMGEKPLYYASIDGLGTVFASELKGLVEIPCFTPRLSRRAVSAFLRYGYVPTPLTIFEDVHKLVPGTRVTVTRDGRVQGPSYYWNPADVVRECLRNPIQGSESNLLDRLEDVLRAAVSRCQVSDVPLGVFLSGGIDSSLLTALMQEERKTEGAEPVQTYTIGFPGTGYNEAEHARDVSEHLGTDHTEMTVTPREVREAIPEMPRIYDEPFADPSQVPTYIVSKLAREHVTVALSGEGGDELFGGYAWHYLETGLFERTRRIPQSVRNGLSRLITVPGPRAWDKAGPVLAPLLSRFGGQGSLGNNLHRGASLVAAEDEEERYRQLRTVWSDNEEIMADGTKAEESLPPGQDPPDFEHPAHRFMYRDLVTYLPDDILVKVDRASMAVSLETRAPLLNHDVVEFAWRLPRELKVDADKGKLATRRILYRHVPQELVDRPKAGFLMPIDTWLREDLQDWAGKLLNPQRLRRQGLLDPEPVRQRWNEHQSGERDRHDELWTVLMLQAWLDEHHALLEEPAC